MKAPKNNSKSLNEKIRLSKRLVLTAVSLLLLAACTDTQSLVTERGKAGRSFTCLASYDRVYDAALETLKRNDFKIIMQDKREGTILASDKIRFLNGGGHVALFFEKVDPAATRVEIHSKPAFFLPIPTVYLAAEQRISKIHEGIHSVIGS